MARQSDGSEQLRVVPEDADCGTGILNVVPDTLLGTAVVFGVDPDTLNRHLSDGRYVKLRGPRRDIRIYSTDA